jgi:hypothetical protein
MFITADHKMKLTEEVILLNISQSSEQAYFFFSGILGENIFVSASIQHT